MRITIKKGLNLDIAGAVGTQSPTVNATAKQVAIWPDDYPGFVPKLSVKEGVNVERGTMVLYDKDHPAVGIVSPVSGTVSAVVRGERRKIERIVIDIDGADKAVTFDKPADDSASIKAWLAASGMLARMRQRPYDIVPNPDAPPRDIFVTAMDTAPLSPGMMPQLANDAKAMIEKAVSLLRKVTDGKVYISVGSDWTLGDIAGAEMVEVTGPHPAGCVGVQIANIAPVDKGDTVWTADIVTLYKIGKLYTTGSVDTSTVVAVTGPEVQQPRWVSTVEGADINAIVGDDLAHTDRHLRIISGNVLTGTKIAPDGFLQPPFRQVTVILDGDDAVEFMGWASLSPSKMSVSPTFPGHFLHKAFCPDARLNGGRRAMIMSNYDRFVPMDIMTEYLLKAIIGRNIEDMEALGIYEVAPEDFALCEYADISKNPIQHIIREGLDYLRKELS